MTLNYAISSNIGGRAENEDSLDAKRFGESFVAVVADGLGGQGDGKAASSLVCSGLMRCGADGTLPNPDQVKKSFEETNQELIDHQKNSFHMKSTAVYLCIQGQKAVWAHVGDSRLYYLRQGSLVECTMDHSVAQLSVLMGHQKREDIPKDPARNRLVRVMGVKDEITDVHEPIQLDQGVHGFLLCTDGLWEYLSDEEIEAAFCSRQTAEACLSDLLQLRIQRAGESGDNYSAVVIYVKC